MDCTKFIGAKMYDTHALEETPEGKAMASKLVLIVEKIDEEFFGAVSRKDQQSLIHILADLVSKIDKWSK